LNSLNFLSKLSKINKKNILFIFILFISIVIKIIIGIVPPHGTYGMTTYGDFEQHRSWLEKTYWLEMKNWYKI